MQSLFRDLRFGARILLKSPAFSMATILMLALGIGVNTAIFTVTNALLLKPFPYHDPEQLVSITAKEKGIEHGGTLLRYELVRDQARSFQSVAVWTSDNLNLSGEGEPVQASIARVSPSFFATFGVRPELGRTFTEEEGRPEGGRVVMLSDALWRNRYHADPAIVGKVVTLDSTSYTVVGVLPEARFPFMDPADIWTPRYFEFSLMSPQRLRLGVGYLNLVARLKPGVDRARADAELAGLNGRYRQQNPNAPDAGPDVAMRAEDLRDEVLGGLRARLWVLTGAVGLVLLIACANAAGLLLARALSRRKEIAVRAAMGATRVMIVRQLLSESLLMSLIAGALGAGSAWLAVPVLAKWGAGELHPGTPIAIDLHVLLFTLTTSLLVGIVFGLVPAMELARVEPNATLRDEGRGASHGRTRARMQNLLVAGQVALSLVLLIGAGLLLRSFLTLLAVDPGFAADHVLTMNLSLSTVKYAKPAQQIAFFSDVLSRLSSAPGVRSAAVSAALPLAWKRITPMLPEGQPEAPLAQRPFIDIEAISPRWFETMRVPMRAGRAFNAEDNAQAPKVLVVNEAFARQFWPGQNAIGKHVIVGRGPDASLVVGISADVRNRGIDQQPQPQAYTPFEQLPWADMNLLVRTAVDPLAVASAVRAQIAAVDPDQPVTAVQTAEELMDASRAQPRFTLLLVCLFSAAALILAVIGVYAVLSFSVAQRRQEFCILLALGARRAEILQLVLRHGLTVVLAGIGAGLAAAFLLTGLVRGLLYQVGTRDAFTFLSAPAIFLAVALIAGYFAARRALQVNPIEALR